MSAARATIAGTMALAALAIPATALAHTTAATASCESYGISGANYARGGSVSVSATIDGLAIALPSVTVTPPATAYAGTFAWPAGPLHGAHAVTITTAISAPDFTRGPRIDFSGIVVCPVAAPVPPVTEAVPDAPGPTAVPPEPPIVSIPRKPDRPPKKAIPPKRITCAYLRSIGAGPRTYTRLGHYPGCVVPRTISHPRRITHVAVTG